MITQTPRKANLALLLLVATLACTPLFAADNPTSVPLSPTNTVISVVEAGFTPEPLPTLISPIGGETALTPIPTPEVDLEDLSLYRQAMRPEFEADVDDVAATGASRYYLEVTIQPESFNSPEGLQLNGAGKIRYTNKETISLSEIYLILYPNLPGYGGWMKVDRVLVDNQLAAGQLEANRAALQVKLPSPLPPEASTELVVFYQAVVPAQPQQGYNIFSLTNGTAALAGFYPAIAVYDAEGWDIDAPPIYGDAVYLDIALYQVDLTVPAELVVAASGSLLAEETHGDGTKTLSFVSGPIRDFYLALRADFQVASEVVDGIKVNSYYPPYLETEGKLALQHAGEALRIFSQEFGPYPYAEFDIVATPTTAGGVEYPGIVVVAENVYNQNGLFFPHVVAHEVAHQWWYNLVGNDQVDEPWLDESLTNYSTVLYWEEISGEATAEDVIETFFLGPYGQVRDQEADRDVLGPVSDYDQNGYGIFIYAKGPLFFDALRREVGPETYQEIMQTYLATYKYKIAGGDDLLQIIESVSGQNITPLVETWLQGK